MSFQQGLSGLNSASKNLDVIGNNVANSTTVGFKSSRAEFADVYANSLAGAGSGAIGIGTQVATVAQQFTQGNIVTTSNPLDIAVNGPGFFRISTNGVITYTRNGQFELDKDGFIVTATGSRLTGYAPDANGQIQTATPGDLRLSAADLSPKATTEGNIVMNLDARAAILNPATFSPTNASTYSSASAMTIYDSQGNAHALTLYYVKTAANDWSVFGALDGALVQPGPIGTLAFEPSGLLTAAPPFTLSLAIAGGPVTPQDMDLSFTGTTQFGSNSGVNEVTQDGYGSGRLSGFAVGDDGVIVARYSNGQTLVQGQIVLANFRNPQGLAPLGNNQWEETSKSGQPLIGAPQTGNLGVLQSGALEESNVDLTAELVNMITAQRIYQANAQTIKAQDTVLQTLVNI